MAALEPGLLNFQHLDDSSHVQRQVKWIGTADLFTNDAAAAGANSIRSTARLRPELLIYYLMNSPQRCRSFKRTSRPFSPVDKENTGSTTPKWLRGPRSFGSGAPRGHSTPERTRP